MPSRPPFKPAPSLKPAEAAAMAATSNRALSNLLPTYVARLPPPAPLSDTVQGLRRNWKFAAVCQFLFTFSDTVLVGEEWSTKTFEDALDGKDSSYVPRLCIKLLQTLTLSRNIDTSNYIKTIQAQHDKRLSRQWPVSDSLKPRPPAGSDPFPTLPSLSAIPLSALPPANAPKLEPAELKTERDADASGAQALASASDAPAVTKVEQQPTEVPLITDITTLAAGDQVEILHILCEWHMQDPDRLRKLMKNEDDPQSWRIEPIGWDAEDNTYFLFDDNRLWIQRARPRKPRPAPIRAPKKQKVVPKKGAVKGKRSSKAAASGKKGGGRKSSQKGKAPLAHRPKPNGRKRPRGSGRVAVDILDDDEDDENYDDESDEEDADRPSSKRRGVASKARNGSSRAQAVPVTPRGTPGRRGRRSGTGSRSAAAAGSSSTTASPAATPSSPAASGPRSLRARTGPPPPYAYQTGFAPVPPSRGIRASSRIRGGGIGTSGPFNDDGWQRIPEALLELDESIREEDERKKGRRRSSRHAEDDSDFEDARGTEGDNDEANEDDNEGGVAEAPSTTDDAAAPSTPAANGDAADADVVMKEGGDGADDSRQPEAQHVNGHEDDKANASTSGDAITNGTAEAEKADHARADVADKTVDDSDDDDDLSDLSELTDEEEADEDDGDDAMDDDDDEDSLTPLDEFEDDEDEFEPTAEDFVEFEALCVTKAEWEAFSTRFAKSKNKKEKALHAVVTETILPRILDDFAEEEKRLALEIVMASRKRSSRIASRESEREERERMEAAKQEQEAKMAKLREEEAAKLAKERAEAEAAAAREERIREREERLAAREREILQRMEREEAERIKAEHEREARVARRKAALAAGALEADLSRDNSESRGTSREPAEAQSMPASSAALPVKPVAPTTSAVVPVKMTPPVKPVASASSAALPLNVGSRLKPAAPVSTAPSRSAPSPLSNVALPSRAAPSQPVPAPQSTAPARNVLPPPTTTSVAQRGPSEHARAQAPKPAGPPAIVPAAAQSAFAPGPRPGAPKMMTSANLPVPPAGAGVPAPSAPKPAVATPAAPLPPAMSTAPESSNSASVSSARPPALLFQPRPPPPPSSSA